MTDQSTPQKTTIVNGYSVRYFDYGLPHNGAKDLVLLHGIGASAERWRRVAPILSKQYRVVVPDIVGFGYSDKPTVEYTMDFFFDFLRSFLEELKIHKPSIVGSSFGGHVAAEFAIRAGNDMDRLVLAAPAGMMKTSTPVLDLYIMAALYPTYENALKAFRQMSYDPRSVTEEIVLDFVNRMRLPNAKYAFMSTLLGIRYATPLSGRLANVVPETLIIWGSNDKMIPLDYANEFTEIPKSKLVVIENCGHTPFVERPERFSEIVLRFLDGKDL